MAWADSTMSEAPNLNFQFESRIWKIGFFPGSLKTLKHQKCQSVFNAVYRRQLDRSHLCWLALVELPSTVAIVQLRLILRGRQTKRAISVKENISCLCRFSPPNHMVHADLESQGSKSSQDKTRKETSNYVHKQENYVYFLEYFIILQAQLFVELTASSTPATLLLLTAWQHYKVLYL